jgi:hypothetical protein
VQSQFYAATSCHGLNTARKSRGLRYSTTGNSPWRMVHQNAQNRTKFGAVLASQNDFTKSRTSTELVVLYTEARGSRVPYAELAPPSSRSPISALAAANESHASCRWRSAIKGHFAYAHMPTNGQTSKNRAKPSPSSHSPLDLSPDKKFLWPSGFLDAPVSGVL